METKITLDELKSILLSKEQQLEKLNINGCSPLSSKYLTLTSRIFELKTMVINYK